MRDVEFKRLKGKKIIQIKNGTHFWKTQEQDAPSVWNAEISENEDSTVCAFVFAIGSAEYNSAVLCVPTFLLLRGIKLPSQRVRVGVCVCVCVLLLMKIKKTVTTQMKTI